MPKAEPRCFIARDVSVTLPISAEPCSFSFCSADHSHLPKTPSSLTLHKSQFAALIHAHSPVKVAESSSQYLAVSVLSRFRVRLSSLTKSIAVCLELHFQKGQVILGSQWEAP